MGRLVVVSNRMVSPRDRSSRAGGLAVALREALHSHGGVWFGWSGRIAETPSATPSIVTAGKVTYASIDLTSGDHQAYYVGYANSTLWPLFHYRLGLLEFRRSHFEGYLRVNAAFAKALLPLLQPDDVIWVHDYHLMTLGAELRRLGARNRIGFFLHIPFPATEVFTALPSHAVLVRGLCAYDLIGLQTEKDRRALFDYLSTEAGATVATDGRFQAFGLSSRAGVFPIGIDTDDFEALAMRGVVSRETARLKESLAGRALVIGVDRLDYSKGFLQKIDGYYDLLERRPEHRRRVTFMQVAPVSRGEVAQYRTLRHSIDAAAGRLIGRFAEFDWVPFRYLNRNFDRAALAGFYRAARVGLVTPLRDGMNLVAKEYVAAQDPEDPGVLILSSRAGAAHELKTALVVNPFDIDQISDALHQALTMPLNERRSRHAAMLDVLRTNTVSAWCERFLAALEASAPVDAELARA
ncbi:MAG TPA: alpha,alpha-trehalose-phosphate synthase (UDP-forming) [Alphaproteobacteria bacterium]|jgi:trehalose 6-phosphate synthase|nr:alpha,alpha-trehalose-phosphate synthase (UDP-forming) [Alphaproteobacteria bacterium]